MSMTETQTEQNQQATKPGDNHLSLSGGLLLAGDISMAAGHLYGAHQFHKQGNAEQRAGKISSAITAIGWGLGGIAAFLFGHPPETMKLRLEASRLNAHLTRNGIAVPQQIRDGSPLLQPATGLGRVQEFCYRYPSEILNAVFAVFSIGLIRGGLKAFHSGKKHDANRNSLWIGLCVMIGALGGLFVKEDPEARKKAEHGSPLDQAAAWVKEKPLRFSGSMYMLENAFLANSAWKEFKEFRKDGSRKNFLFSTATLASYLTANSFLMLSSRDSAKHATLTPAQLQQLTQLTEQIIAAQPASQRDAVRNELTSYLAKERGITLAPAAPVADVSTTTTETAPTNGQDWRTRREAEKLAAQAQAPAL